MKILYNVSWSDPSLSPPPTPPRTTHYIFFATSCSPVIVFSLCIYFNQLSPTSAAHVYLRAKWPTGAWGNLPVLQIVSQRVVGPWLSLRQDIDISPKGSGNITEEEAERMEEAEGGGGGKVINAIAWTRHGCCTQELTDTVVTYTRSAQDRTSHSDVCHHTQLNCNYSSCSGKWNQPDCGKKATSSLASLVQEFVCLLTSSVGK